MKSDSATSAIQIERAKQEDIEAITSVLHASFVDIKPFYTPGAFAATTPTADQIRDRWNEGPVWKAVQNEVIVGTVAAVSKTSGLYVRSMAVHPSARGQGIAKRLLQETENFGKEYHHQRLFLSTAPFLKDAIRLYEQFGFQRNDDGPHDLFGMPLFTMVKPLSVVNNSKKLTEISMDDIFIRTEFRPGEAGYVTHLHGALYSKEYGYGLQFESYVAKGLCEFYEKYDPGRNRIWACEYHNRMIGFLLLMDRGTAAQLRCFLIEPEYRGIGLGSKLLNLYMEFLHQCGYKASYLWTTHELNTAALLYKRLGFKLTEEKESTAFGKPVREQRYDLVLP